jgi:hypothetical protein
MNWEAIGAIGDAVGGLAVVASLVYLALQIRHNTRSVEAATYQSVAESMADAAYHLADTPDESLRAFLLYIATLRRYENLHFQVKRGHLSESDVQGFFVSLAAYLSGYGGVPDGFDTREAWELSKSAFHPEFVAFVEASMWPMAAEVASSLPFPSAKTQSAV